MLKVSNLLLLVFTLTLLSCKDDNSLKETATSFSIEFEDDVSPTRALVTAEQRGLETIWKVNSEEVEFSTSSNTGALELIIEPDKDYYIQYETVGEDFIYTFDTLLAAPPLANYLSLYSLNFTNETLDLESNSIQIQYNYEYQTNLSAGSSSGGRTLVELENSSALGLFSPVDLFITSAFYLDPQASLHLQLRIINFSEDPADTLSFSEVNLRELYFSQRFSYTDAAASNPETLIFENSLTGLSYELAVDWRYEALPER